MEDTRSTPRYVGFWARVLAAIADSILMLIVLLPVGMVFFGDELLQLAEGEQALSRNADVVLNYLIPISIVLAFWIYRQATPGKIMVKAVIVDADTLQKPALWQWIVRYLGYYLSMLLLMLGFLWVAWDPKKQGFHDKLARTVVIYHDAEADPDPAIEA